MPPTPVQVEYLDNASLTGFVAEDVVQVQLVQLLLVFNNWIHTKLDILLSIIAYSDIDKCSCCYIRILLSAWPAGLIITQI